MAEAARIIHLADKINLQCLIAVLLILQTGSFLVKDGRKTGAFFSKNTGVRRAKRQAKFKSRPSFAAFSYATARSDRY